MMKSIRNYSMLVWLYIIAYQFIYPIGISEGHPISIFIPIRIDVCGILAFIISFIADIYIRRNNADNSWL